MFIIPVGKQVNWRRPPPATLLLILINVLAFIFIQGDDDRVLDKALAYYQASTLPQLELPYYVSYLKEEQNEKIPADAIFHLNEPELQTMLVMRMQWDEAFMARLRSDKVILSNDSAYPKWRTQRARFDEMIGELSVERFGFKPAEHKPLTLLSHLFMHGDVGHLFGNMLFLFLVGFMTERVLGARAFLLAYFIAGLGAVELFGAVYPNTQSPLVGASGAIAGLMGLYTLIFGLRKVEFFYSIFFYFDYVRAPHCGYCPYGSAMNSINSLRSALATLPTSRISAVCSAAPWLARVTANGCESASTPRMRKWIGTNLSSKSSRADKSFWVS